MGFSFEEKLPAIYPTKRTKSSKSPSGLSYENEIKFILSPRTECALPCHRGRLDE